MPEREQVKQHGSGGNKRAHDALNTADLTDVVSDVSATLNDIDSALDLAGNLANELKQKLGHSTPHPCGCKSQRRSK